MAKQGQHRPAPNRRDTHHILFTRRAWEGQWARKLRGHPYMMARIPRDSMHQAIHEHCRAIPPPPEWVCEAVWHELNDMQNRKLISKSDNILQKINVIKEELSCFDNEQTAYTVKMLEWQRTIILRWLRGEL